MPPNPHTAQENKLAKEIGERIRNRRVERGFPTPISLARHLGFNDSDARTWAANVGSIERGYHFPKPPLLLQLGRALGTTSSYFLGDLDEGREWQSGHDTGLVDALEAITQLRKRGKS